jgi:L-lactate permease
METTFYPVIRHLHSIVRWLLVTGLLTSIVLAISGLSNRKGLGNTGRLIARFTVYFAHLQLLVGIILFLISPRVIFSSDSMRSPILRFFLVEHTSAMLLAIILITIGHIRMKKAADELKSTRTLLWYYIFSLVIILALIPWPFTRYAGHFL